MLISTESKDQSLRNTKKYWSVIAMLMCIVVGSCTSQFVILPRTLAKISKLTFWTVVPIQNCLKWCKMVQNGNFSDRLKWHLPVQKRRLLAKSLMLPVYSCQMDQMELISYLKIVFVKDPSLYVTNRGHERRRRKIVITSAKHKAKRRIALLQVRAPYPKLNSKPL